MSSQRNKYNSSSGSDSVIEVLRKTQQRARLYLLALITTVILFGIYGLASNSTPVLENSITKVSDETYLLGCGSILSILKYKAVAVMTGPTIQGVVYFTQDPSTKKVHITGSLKNLTPNSNGLRGFHIHEYGDATNGCMSSGSHYNPEGQSHGAPHEAVRHIGDLGNVQVDSNGIVQLDIPDALVIHEGIDDLGKGGHPDSLKTGNAGGRAGCAVIGIASARY
ncbi:hypothetical protein Clacol_009903 [Clathrus columnatus]|uniref:Superoxide dismutase [Cu-Zn] n=1 Tax=Clathrus columnatus TaxID=1419009 RepID=A0AAV5AUS2_9AGAM|nr:hypothetical protein Clacol_009903 [Clathrus columnatus]